MLEHLNLPLSSFCRSPTREGAKVLSLATLPLLFAEQPVLAAFQLPNHHPNPSRLLWLHLCPSLFPLMLT
jgi:hypothetical protein